MSDTLLLKIGKRIRELRVREGLSQEELAARCKCHRTYVGMVERAEKSVSVLMLSRFAKAFRMTLAEMLEGL